MYWSITLVQVLQIERGIIIQKIICTAQDSLSTYCGKKALFALVQVQRKKIHMSMSRVIYVLGAELDLT